MTQSNLRVAEMGAAMAHVINEEMTIILNCLSDIRQSVDADDPIATVVAEAQQAARRLCFASQEANRFARDLSLRPTETLAAILNQERELSR